ncbi:MAG TPA: CBS domain-containing protein [Pararhizobium sp.]|nr:CBS domain-containing protein [Pararhizobium sp.]
MKEKIMHVADILKAKGPNVITVRPDLSIEHLVQRLRIANVGALVVSHSGTTVDGIISERDVARGLAEHGADVLRCTVSDLMTHSVVTCSPGDAFAHVAKIMTQRRIRHLPVMDEKALVGIISIGDVVRYRLDELELEANVLRDYAVVRH